MRFEEQQRFAIAHPGLGDAIALSGGVRLPGRVRFSWRGRVRGKRAPIVEV
jgi:hypothetical protein